MESEKVKEPFDYKDWGKRALYLLLADIGYALALDLFYVNNNIAAGGLAGIATIINSFAPIPIGITVFILNIPILIWGCFVKGKKYVLLSLCASTLYSIIVDMLSFLPSLTDDKLVAAVCGGIIYGGSAAMVVRARISSGGTDLLAKLMISKFRSMSLGKMFLFIDGSIVIGSMVAYRSVENGIYAIFAIAVCSIVTDKINSGFNRADVFYIFATKNVDTICRIIMNDFGRGVTKLDGTGMYTGIHKDILMVVVKPNEVPKLKTILKKYDSAAFIVLMSANEIIGDGFEDIDLTSSLQMEREIMSEQAEKKSDNQL